MKEAQWFRKQSKIFLQNTGLQNKTKKWIQQHGSYCQKIKENLSKMNGVINRQFHSGAIFMVFFSLLPSLTSTPVFFFLNSIPDKERRVTPHSNMHIINTLVCMSLARVQYLFTGIFKMQICRNFKLPFTKCWQMYTSVAHISTKIESITITPESSLTPLPYQLNLQMYTLSRFCFYHTLVLNFI